MCGSPPAIHSGISVVGTAINMASRDALQYALNETEKVRTSHAHQRNATTATSAQGEAESQRISGRRSPSLAQAQAARSRSCLTQQTP